MTGLAWFFLITTGLMLAWNAYLMWVNSTLLHDLRRSRRAVMRAQAPRRPQTQADFEERLDLGALRGDLVIPEQRRAGER